MEREKERKLNQVFLLLCRDEKSGGMRIEFSFLPLFFPYDWVRSIRGSGSYLSGFFCNRLERYMEKFRDSMCD